MQAQGSHNSVAQDSSILECDVSWMDEQFLTFLDCSALLDCLQDCLTLNLPPLAGAYCLSIYSVVQQE